MYVTFPVSQRELLQARAGRQRGRTSRQIKVSCALPTARPTVRSGEINFVDVTVDRATDTVLVRAIIPESEGRADRRPAGAGAAGEPATPEERSWCRRRR